MCYAVLRCVHWIHFLAWQAMAPAMNSTPGPPVAPGTIELAGGPKLSRSEARRLKEEEPLLSQSLVPDFSSFLPLLQVNSIHFFNSFQLTVLIGSWDIAC